MKFLLFIANAFINTMGITQPSPQAANRAAWFIVIMLTAVLAAVATIAFMAIYWASKPLKFDPVTTCALPLKKPILSFVEWRMIAAEGSTTN
jgi:ABC-type amino acid transport system permease subunit